MKLLHRHIRARKRRTQGLEPYPTRGWRRVLDRIVLAVGIVGPFTVFPQILKTFTTQDATGVSLAAWALPGIFNIPWILYGIVHRDTPIIVTYSLWLCMNGLVALGVILYG